MISLVAVRRRLLVNGVALTLGWGLLASATAMAQGPVSVTIPAPVPPGNNCPIPPPPPYNGTAGVGTLGYGPPGPQPGWQGFGLGYHLGYGYGGDALGPGAEGGYPFYGGPGYPHPAPELKRLQHTEMFPYYGGPGHPTAENPNFFGWVGPLKADQPVITIGGAQGYESGYGAFTGAIPYPEATFAPYTTTAAAGGVGSGVVTPTPTSPGGRGGPAAVDSGPIVAPNLAAAGSALGIEATPVNLDGGVRGLQISQVYAGSLAAQAGIHAGDVIFSINGYETALTANITWIIANAAPDRVLMLNIRNASNGKVNTYRIQLP